MGMAYWTMDGERRKQEMNAELRIKNILLFAAGVIAMGTTTSCRKDLCYNHDEHALTVKTNVKPSWELEWERPYDINWQEEWDDTHWGRTYDALRPQPASGICVMVYKDNGGIAEHHLPAEGGRVPMDDGTHDLLFYNDDTQYILIDNATMAATASATTRGVSRGGFMELHEGERTVNQPDMLFGHYVEGYTTQRTLENVDLPVEMHPLVYKYLIRYEFESGLEYVALARGAVAGMAESVYLMDGHTGDASATVMYDCTVTGFGAEAVIQSFGVPNYPGDHYTRADGSPATYAVNLEVRLKNGKIVTYEFDITDQMEKQPRGGVIVISGIVVDKEDGEEGSSGFDPSIDGWGEYQDIPVPIS